MNARIEEFVKKRQAQIDEVQNRLGMQRIAEDFQFYSARMLHFPGEAHELVTEKNIDSGDFAFFVNGKYSPDFTKKFLSE